MSKEAIMCKRFPPLWYNTKKINNTLRVFFTIMKYYYKSEFLNCNFEQPKLMQRVNITSLKVIPVHADPFLFQHMLLI